MSIFSVGGEEGDIPVTEYQRRDAKRSFNLSSLLLSSYLLSSKRIGPVAFNLMTDPHIN